MFRLSAFALIACFAFAGAHAQSTKKAPFAAEGTQRNTPPPQQGKPAEKRGWQAASLTCNAQPRCTASPSGQCVAVQHSYKDGERGRALEDIVRRCERANRPDSACGCIAQCRQVAKCS